MRTAQARGWLLGLMLVVPALVVHSTSAQTARDPAPEPAPGPSRPTLTLPLDAPVSIPSAPDDARVFGLLDRPTGIYLYRIQTGRTLALLPRFDIGSLAAVRGRPLESAPTGSSLPKILAPLPGLSLALSAPPAGSIAAGDVNGDGHPEVVLTLGNGEVQVLDASGASLPGWPLLLDGPIHDGPTLADINGDGRSEILVSTEAGFAHVLLGASATELPGWPACLDVGSPGEQLWSAPSVGDLLGTGTVSVALAGTAGTVQVFTMQGRSAPGWPDRVRPLIDSPNPAASYASPVFTDLEGDGKLEILTGFNSGQVIASRATGGAARGWPRWAPGRARSGFGRISIADLDGSAGPEIVLATDRGFPGPPRLCVYRANGQFARGWPVDLPEAVNGGVAVANLDGAGRPELIVAGIGGTGEIGVYRNDGRPLEGWPRRFPGVSFDVGPVVADLDGVDGLEVAVLGSLADYVSACLLLVLNAKGETLPGFPLEIPGCDAYAGGLTACDLDQDGRTELLLAVGGSPQLLGYRTAGIATPASMPWPRSGRGPEDLPRRTGAETATASTGPLAPPMEEAERVPLPSGLPASLDPRSTLTFILHREAKVRLLVLDVRGETVRTLLDGPLPRGLYAITWDGRDERGQRRMTGSYFFQLEVDGKVKTKQLLLLLR